MQKEELAQPQFPALYLCIIIDARHSSRVEIIKDLKASNFFENIIEAKSLDDGLKLLNGHAVDCCILGPSVSPIKAAGLIKKGSQCELSKDCAFIAIVNGESNEKEALLQSGAHRVIETPCSKQVFREGLVRGVISANANSPWTGVLLHAEENNLDAFAEPPAGSTIPKPAVKDNATLNPVALNQVMKKATPLLQKFLNNADQEGYDLDANGKPNSKSNAALQELVNVILKDSEIAKRVPAFQPFYFAALQQWFAETRRGFEREANAELRRQLFSFRVG